MRPDIDQIAFIATWCVVPSYFWLRGIWKNDKSDRMLAGGLLALFPFMSVLICQGTFLINDAGYWVFALGIMTLILGTLGKRMTFRQVLPLAALLIAAGIVMSLLV